jgi:glucose/arabinose dehydrogenase
MSKAAVLATIAAAIVAVVPSDAHAQLRTQLVANGLSQPLAFVQDPGLPNVFYIVQQSGRVRILQDGVLQSNDLADLSGLISCCGERGLLGMAFAPDAASSGRVFFAYTNPSGATVISRFRRVTSPTLRVDPATRLDLLWSTGERFIPQPFANHNGGHLAFGPDGYLYIGKGDGGSGNDPQNHAQRADSLLGKMLRIDVNVLDTDPEGPNGMRVPPDNPFRDGVPISAMPEIWAFGLRNPWRYSFDDVGPGATGALIIGDVGQGAREEISYEPRGAGGRNYGWRIREGTIATPNVPATMPAFTPLMNPIHDYMRSEGASVTGGFVYRGALLGNSFRGRYFYADFISSRVWSIGLSIDQLTGEAIRTDVREHTSELAPLTNISSFGRDAAGELYLVTFGGEVRKIVPSGATPGTISDIANQTINEDSATATLNFTINDVDDPQTQWTVTASSSNTALIPDGNLILSGTGSNRSIVVTPVANGFGAATITVRFSSDSTRPSAFVTDTFVVTVNPVNDPPSIADVPNTTTSEDVATPALAVSISDLETAAASLTLTATSSNQTLVPNAAIVLAGQNSSRTLAISPVANQSGTTTITLTVSDGTATAVDTLTLTVTPVNDAPTISSLPDQSAPSGTAMIGPLAFVVGDLETQPSALTVTGTSSNPAVVLSSGVALGGTGANRSVQITFVPGATGAAGITLTVSDGSAQAITTFAVIVAGPPPAPAPPPPPPPPAPTLPAAPRNLIADSPNGRTIALRWDAPADIKGSLHAALAAAVTGYRIELGTASGRDDAGVFSVGNATTFSIGNLAAGQYFVRVRAMSDVGLSDPSNEVVATLDGSTLAPRAPRNLRATVVGTTLQLDWDVPADAQGLVGYAVEAGSGPGLANYARALVPAQTLTIQRVPPSTYHLRVRAITSSGDGPSSNELVVIIGETAAPCVSPSAPIALAGQALGTTLNLAWRAPATGNAPSRYVIQAGSTSGASDIAAIPIDGSFTSIAGAAPNGTFFFRVIAINECGISEPSNEISVTVGGPLPPVPGPPTSVTSEVVGSRVTLTWSPPVSGGPVVSYVIAVRDAAGNALAALGTGNAASFLSQDNVPPGVYLVTVQGVNAAGAGPPSEVVTVRVP